MPKQKILAGIDVGSSKVATIIASVSEEKEIRVLGSSHAKSKGVKKGQITNIEEAIGSIINSVEAAERMAGYSLTDVYVTVGGQQIVSKNSTGVVAVAEPEGEITVEDVRRVIEGAKAVSLPSSREVIDVIPRSYTVDGQGGIADPIGMSGVRLEVETHIITGLKTSIKNLSKCVSELGVNINALVATGAASAESTLSDTEKELGVVLIDIGGGTTSLAIFIEGSPVYTSVLPIGARNVTNDLAVGLRLPLEQAEKVKILLSEDKKQPEKVVAEEKKEEEKKKDKDEIDLKKEGITDEDKTILQRTVVEGIIRPRLNEIFNLAGEEIKNSGYGGKTPAGLVLSGGGALTVGVVNAAKRTLSLPVRVGAPQRVSGLVDDILSPEYAAGLGLIHYAIRREEDITGKFSFDLIGNVFGRIPVKGVVERTIDLVKSILP